jgi:anti-sigma factor RsiW
MNSNEDMEYKLSQLLDGQLGPDESNALLKRIDEDPALREQFRLYQSLEEGLSRQGAQMPAVDWELQREAIHSVLEREALLKMSRFAWPVRAIRWSAAVAAVAAIITLAGLLSGRLPNVGAPASSDLSVAYDRPAGIPAGQAVLTSGMILPQSPAQSGDVVAAVQEDLVKNQNVHFERVSALSPSNKEITGTVVVSVGAREGTASSANAWFFRDLQ